MRFHPLASLAALACAATSTLALAQRPEMPPIYPAATRPVARALAAPAATPAVVAATPKAAFVETIDGPLSAVKEGVFSSCSVAGVCTVPFSTVAAGHRRLVEHLTCSIYVASSTGTLRYVAFLANSFTAPREFVPFTRSPADAGQYFVDISTGFPFDGGETPLVYAYADGAPIQDLTCTTLGREVVLP